LGVVTHPLATEPIGVRPDTAVIGIVSRVALRRAGADGLAIVGILTLCAHHQPLEQIAGTTLALAGPPPIALSLLLHGRKQLPTDQRGHGYFDPLLLRHILHADGTPGL